MQLPRMILALTLAFAAMVMGAWAWFHVLPPKEADSLRFVVRTEMDGWEFESQPVGEAAMRVLATTNLVNGTFRSTEGQRVTVFAADWHADDGGAMSVVQHTPDICWVGAGWTAVDLGQPRRVEWQWGQRRLPFECRAFVAPGGGHRELAVWCTLLGGTPLEESDRWITSESPQDNARARQSSASRRLGASLLFRNVLDRRAATREKQFVRFSVPASPDWAADFRILESFATRWIEVRDRP